MICEDTFFDEVSGQVALWCGASTGDSGDLARTAERAAAYRVPLISVVPDDVAMLWTWLEKAPARIYARFYLPPRGSRDDAQMSELATRINSAFKHGASGAQVFLRASDLADFTAQMKVVRDDLFFNKDFSVGLDISEIEPYEWGAIFDALHLLRATALVLVLARDAGLKSDFVGRLYGALEAMSGAKFDLHFVLRDPYRIEQTIRLARAMRPEYAGGIRIFVQPGADNKGAKSE